MNKESRESKWLMMGFALVIVMIIFASCDSKPVVKQSASQSAALTSSEKTEEFTPLQDPSADPAKQNVSDAAVTATDSDQKAAEGADAQDGKQSAPAQNDSDETFAPLQDPSAEPAKQNASDAAVIATDSDQKAVEGADVQDGKKSATAQNDSDETFAPLQDPSADPAKQNASDAAVKSTDADKKAAEGADVQDGKKSAPAKDDSDKKSTPPQDDSSADSAKQNASDAAVKSTDADQKTAEGADVQTVTPSVIHITTVKEGEKSPLVALSEAQDLNKKGPDQVHIPENTPAAEKLDNLGNEVAQLQEAPATPNQTAAMTKLVEMGKAEQAAKPIPPSEQKVIKLRGETMGTYWQVLIAYPLDDTTQARLREQIEQRLQSVNQQMSTYISDSELSLFNRANTTKPVKISPELRQVIAASLEISKQSKGMYDVTVQPLVELWGFGPARPTHAPTDSEISTALAKVGYEKLSLTPEGLSKTNPETAVDLSSIAKGYGVDQVGAIISAAGYDNYLVDIGGEILAGGDKYGKAWSVAIETPEINGSGDYQSIVPLGGNLRAIATSGNYRNFINYGNVRAVHTVNPKTGQTEQSTLLSASVISDNCMLADGYATALMALGADEALSFAEKQGLSALLIFSSSRAGEFEIKRTKAFARHFGE